MTGVTAMVARKYDAYLAELGWQKVTGVADAAQYTILLELVMAVEASRSQLRHHIANLRRDLDDLEQSLEAKHGTLNSLGMLQQRPAAVEAAVGALAASQRLLEGFLKVYRPHPDADKLGCAVCGDPRDQHPAGPRLPRSSTQHLFRRP